MGITQLVGAYGGYKGEGGFYAGPRDESPPKEFFCLLICPTANIGGVIGKGSAAINQIKMVGSVVTQLVESDCGGDGGGG
ncbi:hypothetical protein Hdeb2414_s0016g00491471 [Helianthus debilis subsp. tardiflorus]